jgi:hypothetical protein
MVASCAVAGRDAVRCTSIEQAKRVRYQRARGGGDGAYSPKGLFGKWRIQVDGRGLMGFWEILTYNGNFSTQCHSFPFIPLIPKQALKGPRSRAAEWQGGGGSSQWGGVDGGQRRMRTGGPCHHVLSLRTGVVLDFFKTTLIILSKVHVQHARDWKIHK